MGIQPDVIVCRADQPVDDALREKISLFCDVEERAVVSLPTVDTIYEVPLLLEQVGLGDFVVERLRLPPNPPDLTQWQALVDEIKRPKPSVRVAIVGKYVELHDAYVSVREALHFAAVHQGCDVDIEWVSSEHLKRGRDLDRLERVDGMVVPGGFGYRGIEGKVIAARFARENRIPYLGLCLGMQVMTIELARHFFDSDEPNSTEFDENTKYPVIDLMPEQREVTDMGGTMRLGNYPCRLVEGTGARSAYGKELTFERHRHRFELNNLYRNELSQAGMVFSGLSPNGRLVEIAELRDHPFMVGSQFHPEFKSRPTRPHPLFTAFIQAVQDRISE